MAAPLKTIGQGIAAAQASGGTRNRGLRLEGDLLRDREHGERRSASTGATTPRTSGRARRGNVSLVAEPNQRRARCAEPSEPVHRPAHEHQRPARRRERRQRRRPEQLRRPDRELQRRSDGSVVHNHRGGRRAGPVEPAQRAPRGQPARPGGNASEHDGGSRRRLGVRRDGGQRGAPASATSPNGTQGTHRGSRRSGGGAGGPGARGSGGCCGDCGIFRPGVTDVLLPVTSAPEQRHAGPDAPAGLGRSGASGFGRGLAPEPGRGGGSSGTLGGGAGAEEAAAERERTGAAPRTAVAASRDSGGGGGGGGGGCGGGLVAEPGVSEAPEPCNRHRRVVADHELEPAQRPASAATWRPRGNGGAAEPGVSVALGVIEYERGGAIRRERRERAGGRLGWRRGGGSGGPGGVPRASAYAGTYPLCNQSGDTCANVGPGTGGLRRNQRRTTYAASGPNGTTETVGIP